MRSILEQLMFLFRLGHVVLAGAVHILPSVDGILRKTASDLQHARTLLNLYSQNPCSYLTLEDDKILYFGKQVDGVIPYDRRRYCGSQR